MKYLRVFVFVTQKHWAWFLWDRETITLEEFEPHVLPDKGKDSDRILANRDIAYVEFVLDDIVNGNV